MPRLEQILKDYAFNGNSYHQTISCSDLSGFIGKVTVSMTRTERDTANWRMVLSNGSRPTHTSEPEILGLRDVQSDIVFSFTTPVNVDDDLCTNGGVVSLDLYPDQTGQNYTSTIHGNPNNPYTNGHYSFYAPSLADIYFIINGEAEVNHKPVLDPVGDQAILEGRMLTVTPTGSDIDQTPDLSYAFTNLPEGAYVVDKTLHWVPDFEQAGVYENIEVIATDAGNANIEPATDKETISIVVTDQTPTLHRLEQIDKSIALGENSNNYHQTLSCRDLSGNIEKIEVSMTRTERDTANWRMVLSNGSRPTHTSEPEILGLRDVQTEIVFNFTRPIDVDTDLCLNGGTVYLDLYPDHTGQNHTSVIHGGVNDPYPNGRYSFYSLSNSDIYFVVNPHSQTNNVPVFNTIGNQTVAEGETLQFTITATDPDSDNLTYSATNTPEGSSFDPNTGVFTWTPGYDDVGIYSDIVITVADNGEPSLSTFTSFSIEVVNTNRAPILDPIGSKTVAEGQTLQLTLIASDPDGDNLTYSATNTPEGSMFYPNTGVFTWTPGFDAAGNYTDIEFAVMDDGEPMELDVELITITVGDVNRPPVLTSPGSQEVLEDELLTFTVSASDPDGDSVALTASGTPTGSTFSTSTGEFSWTPSLSQDGFYTVVFIATDDGSPSETAMLEVVITVGDNPTPTEQAVDLVEDVVIADLPQNAENSYLANLKKVEKFIEEGKIQAALNQLKAFIDKVEIDYQQGLITQQERDYFIEMATNLIDDLTTN